MDTMPARPAGISFGHMQAIDVFIRRCLNYLSSSMRGLALLCLAFPFLVASAPSFQHTHGPKRLLYILCQYSNQTVPPTTVPIAQSSLSQVAQFYFNESHQQMTLTYTVTDPLLLTQTASYYASTGLGQLYTDAVEIAKSQGWDSADYDFVFIRHSGGTGGVGVGQTGEKGAWVQTDNWNVLAHELGHNLGLDHANGWRPTTSAPYGPGNLVEYGDSYDLMGPNRGSLSPYEQSILLWLPESAIARVATNGIYRLYALDVAAYDSNRLYSIVLRKDVREYWLDYRGQFQTGEFAPFTLNGLQIRWARWSQSRGGSTLLDATPGTPRGFDDGPLLIGRTFSDAGAGVHITVVNRSLTPGQWLDVAVQVANSPSNSLPIVQITASKTNAAVGEVISFAVTGSDPDGDTLAYGWESSVDGNATILLVSSNSPSLTYSWSAAGRYEVLCRVSDGKGGLANAGIIVTIGTPVGFTVEGIVVDSAGAPVPNVQVFTLPNGVGISDGGYVSNPTYRADWTDDDGRFHLLNVPSGSYTVRALPTVTRTFGMTNGNGQIAVGPDITNLVLVASLKPSVSVRGFVRDGAQVISNVVLQLGGLTTASMSDGSFTFSNVPPASHVLTAQGQDQLDQFIHRNNPIYVDGLDLTNVVVERVLYLVQGTVPRDLGLIRVGTIDRKRRVLAQPDFDDPLADWSFEIMLPRGIWNLEATLSGYTFSPSGFTNPVVVAGVEVPEYTSDGMQPYSLSNLNFSPLPGTFSIKGRITVLGEPLSGANVSIGSANAFTDNLGFYQFVGLTSGVYSLDATLLGYVLISTGFTNPVSVGPSAANIDFAATPISSLTILSHPQSQLVTISSNVTFAVTAAGTPPLAYQWFFNGALPILGATNSAVTITNVQDDDGGFYSVVVGNGASVTSSPALLTVNHPPVPASPVLERYAFTGTKARLADFLGSDSDGDLLSLFSVGPGSAQGGTVTTNSGWVIYTPPPGFTNVDSFPFAVSDGRGGISLGTANVVVTFDNVVPQNFRAEMLGNGSVRLIFDGIQSRTYSIEYAENLESPAWQKLATVTADEHGVFVYTDLLPNGAPQRFYRATWP